MTTMTIVTKHHEGELDESGFEFKIDKRRS